MEKIITYSQSHLAVAVAILAAAAVLSAGAAWGASGDAVKRMLGGISVHALSDAEGGRGPDVLIGVKQEQLSELAPSGKLHSFVNAFLVEANGKTLLFDTGNGPGRGGRVLDALRNAGVKPEDIDAVFLTHLHGDHVGGLLRDGNPVYPRADVFLSIPERTYWLDEKNAGGGFALARNSLAQYGGRVKAFASGTGEIIPGVSAMPAYGHTPGHTMFLIASGGDSLVVCGDIAHFAEVQFPLPEITVTYDFDPEMARTSRIELFKKAATEGVVIAGMHLPYPGIGKVKAEGRGYAFEPLNE